VVIQIAKTRNANKNQEGEINQSWGFLELTSEKLDEEMNRQGKGMEERRWVGGGGEVKE